MSKDNYTRSVSLHCPDCGKGDFEHDDEIEDGPIRCTSCDRIFNRTELIEANQRQIDSSIEEMGDEVVRDLEASLRNAFKGSKGFSFK